jgi:M6 family metalloprotease-like protein
MKRILFIMMGCVLAMGVNAATDKKVLRLPCTVEPLQLSISPKDLNANYTYRQLVVLVSFSDCDFSQEDPKATYEAMFNQRGYNQRDGAGCVTDYFRDQSNGLFNLEFDVYGPIKVNSKAQKGSDGQDFRSSIFVEALRTLVAQEPGIDFSLYDWNGNKVVNQVIFVYAGYAGNQPGLTTYTWPSTGSLGEVTTPDGYQVYNYSASGELWSNNTSCGIGTICHEFSHCLGLPDVYPTNTNDSSLPISIVDEWDLMDGGNGSNRGWCPPNYSALEKMQLGWLTPTELTADTVITGMKSVSDGGEVYLIRHTENEYYLLENRQWQGWDVAVPGHGLLVWHVNYNASKWNNNVVNNTAGKPNYHLVTADNLDYDAWLDLYYKRGGGNPYLDRSRQLHRCLLSSAPYPWATDSTDYVNNELTNTSTPAAIMYNKNAEGSTLLSKPITDITEHDDGTISFVFHASTPDGLITPSAISHQPSTIYTLTGRKVQTEAINRLPKGFYIINGKKTIIK